MRWPWRVREQKVHEQAVAAAAERDKVSRELIDRAQSAVAEALQHKESNHFAEALEELMWPRKK